MSELGPITAELRELMGGVEPRVDEDGVVTAKYVTPEAWGEFVRRCDAIDAIHAGLERENAELRQRVEELGSGGGSMHDGGSITDELRKVAAKTECANGRCEKLYRGDLEHIADRIDAEHERVCNEQYACGAEHGIGASIEASMIQDHGYIELPKDADGEYIRIGDVMEWVRYKDGDPTIVRTVSGIGNGVFFAWSDEQGRYAQYEAHAYRHHHAPTVEDVLREMADRCYADEDEPRDRDAIVAEFAAKLRLAGDAS